METFKTSYTLFSVHTGKVKTKNGDTDFINNIKNGDLLTFKLKRDAISYIKLHNAWALQPIKIVERSTKWHGQTTYYRFDICNF